MLVLLCLVLVAAPLALGANRPWAWTILEGALFALLSLWAVSTLKGRRSLYPVAARPIYLAMGLWLVYGASYLLPLPASVAEWMSPPVHAVYDQVRALSAAPDSSYFLTIDRRATTEVLLKYAMYGAAFFLVTVLAAGRTRLKAVLWTLLAAGALQVVLAVSARAIGIDLTPRDLMDGHWDVLRGTFVNRNHFGGFLAMTAAAGIGLSLAYLDRPPRTRASRARFTGAMMSIRGPVLLSGAAVLLIGAGMILSTSRGAIMALFGGLVAVLAASVAARGLRAREMILAWALGLAVIGALAWPGSRSLIARFQGGLLIDERWTQWAGTRDLIADHWLTGTGPGTYRYAFTAYKDGSLRSLLYDHAHNDYLQLLAEQGILGAGLLLAVLALVLHRLIGTFMRRRDILVRGALFASLTGMAAMLIHGLVDFNFQIPANALYFWVLAGIGVAATRLEHQGHNRYVDHWARDVNAHEARE